LDRKSPSQRPGCRLLRAATIQCVFKQPSSAVPKPCRALLLTLNCTPISGSTAFAFLTAHATLISDTRNRCYDLEFLLLPHLFLNFEFCLPPSRYRSTQCLLLCFIFLLPDPILLQDPAIHAIQFLPTLACFCSCYRISFSAFFRLDLPCRLTFPMATEGAAAIATRALSCIPTRLHHLELCAYSCRQDDQRALSQTLVASQFDPMRTKMANTTLLLSVVSASALPPLLADLCNRFICRTFSVFRCGWFGK